MEEQKKLSPDTVRVGEGVTVSLYTDKQAHTVIAVSKTGKTITVQRDKVERLTKPEFVAGGFAGYCTNLHDIKYDITPDKNGATSKAYWSDRYGAYYVSKCFRISAGRHERYDYNF